MDGAVDADTAWLAGFVADALAATGRPVARVSWRGFWRARSLRLEHGRDDPDSYYDLWTDVAGLRREVLDTMGPGGPGTWLPSLWDAGRDRASRAARVRAAPGTVVVLDGPFLLRPELDGALDAVVHLRTSDAAVRRRVPEGQTGQVLGAWHRYCAEVSPEAAAAAVLRFEDPRHPALVLRG
ncbi:uridine kinase [Kineococcus sp. NUM-3379]